MQATKCIYYNFILKSTLSFFDFLNGVAEV